MPTTRRFSAGLLLSALCGLAACGHGHGNSSAAGQTCTTLAECPVGNVCINAACVPVCHSSAECSAGQVCEDGLCLAPACGGPADCASGQVCQGGACVSAINASQIASCDVSPGGSAVVNAGATLQFVAVAKDASGRALPFTGFTWGATGGASVTGGLVTAGTSAGLATITATAGGKTCSATVTIYPAVASGDLRVVVIDSHSKAPISGAVVVLDTTATKVTTGADGSASFPSVAAGLHDVHVIAPDHDYASFIQTSSHDLLAPLNAYVPPSRRSGFSGHLDDSGFANLNVQGEAAHLAFFGSGIAGSLLDLSVSTLVGPLHPVTITLGSSTKTLSLPYGLVLGVGSTMFNTQDYRIYADAGKRDLWGLGGNVNLTQVVTALGPVLSGGGANIDFGAVLPQLLPLFGKLQAGTVRGAVAPPNAGAGGIPTFTPLPGGTLGLDTPLRLRLTPHAPDLPQFNGAYVDGVIAVAGALDYPLGFVPLGLTAGISAKDANNHNTAKVLDPTCDTSGGMAACATSDLPLRLAAENGGTEGSKYGVALLAVNFSGLQPGTAGGVAISGLLHSQDQVHYVPPPAAGPAVSFDRFMNIPGTGAASVAKATRTVTVSSDADPSAQLYRVEIENAARLNWTVYMDKVGASARSVTLPDVTTLGSFTNPFADANNDAGVLTGPSARILAIKVTDSSQTAASLETFGSLTLDQLGNSLAAFTAASVPIN